MLEFDMNAGQLPVIRKVASPQTLVVAVATLGERGQLSSSSKALKVSVNGQDAQEVGEQAVLPNLLPDRNVLVFDDLKNPVTVTVQADANPRLAVFVGAQPNVGNLEITVTGKVDGLVSVDPEDKKEATRTQKLTNGRATFNRLPPKAYLVEVSAPGYASEKKSVSIKKGDVTPLPFTLQPKITVTSEQPRGRTSEPEVPFPAQT